MRGDKIRELFIYDDPQDVDPGWIPRRRRSDNPDVVPDDNPLYRKTDPPNPPVPVTPDPRVTSNLKRYEAYVDAYPDLKAAWRRSGMAKGAWGKLHYDTHGRRENRLLTGPRKTVVKRTARRPVETGVPNSTTETTKNEDAGIGIDLGEVNDAIAGAGVPPILVYGFGGMLVLVLLFRKRG